MTSKIFNGVRGKQIFLTFTVVICTIILILSWERTPLAATLLPSQEHIEIHPADHSEEDKLRQHEENLINTTTVLPITEQPEQVSAAAPVASIEDSSTKSRNEDEDTNLTPADKKAPVADHSEEDKLSQHEENLINTTTVLSITEQPEQVSAAAPVASIEESSMKSRNEDEGTNLAPADKKECNYAKGKWVPDDKRPLYLGSDCKQWLSVMWACKLMQRTDFSYEDFRWQPENCEMPDFESSAFLKRMKDKTIAFVGDSLGRQQFQSLMCMATAGKMSPGVQNVGREYGLVKPRGAIRPDGWAYRFPRTNTTILYYWSASLCKLEPLNILNSKTNYAMHLDKPAGFMKHYLHRFDVLVLNTGHHWNRGKLNANRWEMYVGGMPVKDGKLANIANARNFTVYSIVKWLDSQLPNHPRLQAFFRTLSPRHFVNGDWNTGGSCDNTIPLIGGSQVSQNGSSDAPAETAVRGTNVTLLDITALSRLRDEGHISRYSIKASTGVHDCLHWCLPGIPDAWNEILYAEILSKDQQIVKVP